MKKTLAILTVLCLVLGICGCKSQPDNSSSDVVDVEYEEIIVDEGGNTITSSDQTTTSSQDAQSNPTTSSNNNSSTVDNSVKIDYDTIVEVDICDDIVRGYLSADDANNQYYWLSNFSGNKYDYQNLSLSWKMAGGPYTVYFSENADFSNAITLQTSSSTIKNSILVPGKTYYWKVIGAFSSDILGGGRIKVKDEPVRWIQIDGTGNVRDLGGWKTTSGKTVKYGMIYRGQKLEGVTANGIATIKQLGLKTELDIRYATQKFQTPGTGMNYEFIESPGQYDNVMKAEPEVFKASYKRVFELLSNESNYPFYAHCNAGADRTGTFAFIVNGVLGVPYEDLTRDFELTSFSSTGKRWRGKGTGNTFAEGDDVMQEDSSNTVAWGRLYKEMMAYGQRNGCTTLEASIEHWLINYIGVPKSQIDSYRNIMLK
ncbi:MAG: tyrosine-protein phosphatase [Clostridia bacterium]|nr:tyrosine-protein phosphatase [Clostridia bacterium]